MVAAVNTTTNTAVTSGATAAANGTDASASQDRFLKLLVAQLNNQDPMNPMDNAQMTTQLAQINTVTGIQQLNQTVTSLVSQFSSMQMLQGSSLVGHDVLTAGSTISKDGTTGRGGVELAGAADSVSVQVINASGAVVDTVDMGAQTAGRHTFTTDLSKYDSSGSLSFKVIAVNGTQTVTATPLIQDKVTSVGSDTSGLTLDLANSPTVSYTSIKSVL